MRPIDTQQAAQANVEHRRYGLYLYGITLADQTEQAPATDETPALTPEIFANSERQVRDLNVQFRPVHQIAAVARWVSLDEFDEETLKERATDRTWLEGVVRRHNEVIAAVHEIQPILPAKFGSVYPRIDDLVTVLAKHHDQLLTEIKRFSNRDEWAMHLYANPSAIEERILADNAELYEMQQKASKASAGTAYMLERRLRSQLDNAVGQRLEDIAQHIYHELDDHSDDSQLDRVRELHDEQSDRIEILHAAFLVHREDIDAFIETADRIVDADLALDYELTGPWPPYSFANSVQQENT